MRGSSQGYSTASIYVVIKYNSIYLSFHCLLSMNSVIIHTLRTKSIFKITQIQGESQDQGQKSKSANSEKQIFLILLLVAFSFFFLISPFYAFHMYAEFVDFMGSPSAFAEFFLFYQIMHKMYYTNNAINFFLYVISGQKFRKDLIKLFKRNKRKFNQMSFKNFSETNTRVSTVELKPLNSSNSVQFHRSYVL